jgi:replication factor C large subunit
MGIGNESDPHGYFSLFLVLKFQSQVVKFMMSEPWVEKYRPKTLKEVVGQQTAVSQLLEWAKKWEKGERPPPLLLYGPPGSGKTSAALALAKDMGWDCLELNASDERTYEAIRKFLEGGSMGSLLTGGRKLLLLDEVDNVYERGGYKAVTELIQRSFNPVILTANSKQDVPEGIRKMCQEVCFESVRVPTIVKVLAHICSAEGVKVPPEILKEIAESSNGDLRAAINDLQVTCAGVKAVSEKFVSNRIREINIFQVLGALMKARTVAEARSVLFSLDMPPDDVLGWISENVPLMLKDPEDLERVYRMLAEADLFRARVARRQVYRLEKYMCDLMTAGVAMSRRGEISFVRPRFPTSGVLFARTREMRALRDSIAEKVARHCHVFAPTALRVFLPYLPFILRRSPEIAEVLQLSEEEKKFLGVS